MILARFVLNEPVGTWQFVGSIVAFVGMAVIVTRGDLRALIRLDLNAGEIFVICAAIAFALYTVLLRRAKYPLPGLPLLVLLLGAAVAVTVPFYIWELLHDDRTALNPKGLWALVYVAGPGGALMYYLFNLSVQALGASRAGVFLYFQTVFIAVLAYFFLGESRYAKSAAHRPGEDKRCRRLQAKLESAVAAHRKSGDRTTIACFNRAVALLHVRHQFFENVTLVLVSDHSRAVSVPTVVAFGHDDDHAICGGVIGDVCTRDPIRVMTGQTVEQVENRVTGSG